MLVIPGFSKYFAIVLIWSAVVILIERPSLCEKFLISPLYEQIRPNTFFCKVAQSVPDLMYPLFGARDSSVVRDCSMIVRFLVATGTLPIR